MLQRAGIVKDPEIMSITVNVGVRFSPLTSFPKIATQPAWLPPFRLARYLAPQIRIRLLSLPIRLALPHLQSDSGIRGRESACVCASECRDRFQQVGFFHFFFIFQFFFYYLDGCVPQLPRPDFPRADVRPTQDLNWKFRCFSWNLCGAVFF